MICEMCKLDVMTLMRGDTFGKRLVCCFCSFTCWMPPSPPKSPADAWEDPDCASDVNKDDK